MIIYALVIFGLATMRTVKPLAEKEEVNGINVFFAATHVVAFLILLNHFIK